MRTPPRLRKTWFSDRLFRLAEQSSRLEDAALEGVDVELEALRILIEVAELASFTRAAQRLGMPKSRVSQAIAALEAEVGTRLLQRTTRAVQPTPDGELFLARAKRLVLEADELSAAFQAPRTLRGVVRLDLPMTLARDVVIPRLPELLALHPLLELRISSTDRRVEVIREGFDCVLRVGALVDSGLTAQRLGTMPMINCASVGYVQKYGLPKSLEDLDQHVLVHYSMTLGGEPALFEYRDGEAWVGRPMRTIVSVNNTDAYRAACVAGLGIIQVPRIGVAQLIANGTMIEILPEQTCEPMLVSLVHGHGRNVPKRVRAVMSWLAQLMAPRLA